MRSFERSILAGLALVLAGCSPSAMLERLPSQVGGLPADAPAAPKTPYQYPAVHDMPPPRSDKPLTAEQQDSLEKSLQAARERLDAVKKADHPDGQKDAAKAKEPTKKRAKKKAKTPKKQENAGVAKNP